MENIHGLMTQVIKDKLCMNTIQIIHGLMSQVIKDKWS